MNVPPPSLSARRRHPASRRLPWRCILAATLAAPLCHAETTVTSGGVYRIFDMNSGDVLEVPGSSTALGTQLVQQVSNETPTQYWRAVSVAGGYWKFINVNSGLAMSVVGGSNVAGTAIDQYTDNGTAPQNWTLTDIGDGSYKIVNRNSGMLIQVAGSSTAPQAVVNQKPDNGTATQHWAFEEVAAGGAYPRVYIGGGDNAPGAFNGYLGDTSHWTFVRANADGYYVNNFALNTNTGDTTQNHNLSTMASLFTHKNVFYETDADRATGADDKVKIDIMRQWFNVTYATINKSAPADRVVDLQWREWRPVMFMVAPWEVGGNFNNSSNATVQGEVTSTWGSTIDGPSGYFRDNTGSMQNGCYTLGQFSKSHGELSEFMIATYTSGTNSGSASANGAAFLSAGQTMVRDCENHSASPDIWVISYYAAQVQVYAVTPETTSAGAPGGTVTGLGYWLINHLRDPGHFARLEAMPAGTFTVDEEKLTPANAAEAVIAAARQDQHMQLAVADQNGAPVSQSVHYRLHNDSAWLDLCPLVSTRLSDPGQWEMSVTVDGQEETAAATSSAGLAFVNDLRLQPGQSKDIEIKLTSRTGNIAPADVTVVMNPHPSEALIVRDRSVIHVRPATPVAVKLVAAK